MFPTNDALSRTLGPEAPGYIRGCGFGAILTKVGVAEQIKCWNKAIYDELAELKAWKKQMQSILTSGSVDNKVRISYFCVY